MRLLFYPLGLAIAVASIVASAHHLKQPLSSYFDVVAAIMVFGGSAAVALITLPWEHGRDILRGFLDLILPRRRDLRATLSASLALVREPLSGPQAAKYLQGISRQVLEEGSEMIGLGFNSSTIEPILKERVFQSAKRLRRIANSVRSLAKYPPAFGLMGTVLGLVNLMRGISAGLDAKDTGVQMAVALVATFYGLIFANLIVNPAGEAILRRASEEEEDGELALQAVILAADQTSILEAQELLNSYVAPERRMNVISMKYQGEQENAA